MILNISLVQEYVDYRMRRNPFVYIIFQASSGSEMNKNKGFLLLL